MKLKSGKELLGTYFFGPGARPWKAKHGRATCRETCTCGSYRGPRYTVPICVGPRNLSEIVMAQRQIWFGIPLFPVLVMFFISRLAETNRAPPDLPEAEAESVAGYNAEYARDAILGSSLLAEANVPGSGGLILTETRCVALSRQRRGRTVRRARLKGEGRSCSTIRERDFPESRGEGARYEPLDRKGEGLSQLPNPYRSSQGRKGRGC